MAGEGNYLIPGLAVFELITECHTDLCSLADAFRRSLGTLVFTEKTATTRQLQNQRYNAQIVLGRT